MINRRSVPAPTAHACISEIQPGEKEPDGILCPDSLKTDMTASLTTLSTGLPMFQRCVLDPQSQTAASAQPGLILRPVLHLERHLRNVVAAIGVVFVRHRCRPGPRGRGHHTIPLRIVAVHQCYAVRLPIGRPGLPDIPEVTAHRSFGLPGTRPIPPGKPRKLQPFGEPNLHRLWMAFQNPRINGGGRNIGQNL
jgi:hypothetical protein